MNSIVPTEQLSHHWFSEYPSIERDDTACSDIYSSCIILFWIVGTIFYGKDFAYLHLGPLYITEMVLGMLLLNNLSRMRFSDIFLLIVVVAYVMLGTMHHGSFTFAGKDMIWMPYLFFLRFFPRNFPTGFVKLVVGCCFFKAITLTLLPVVEIFHVQKYRDCLIILFCYLYLYLKGHGKIRWPYILFFIVISVIIGFKTLILVMLVAPFVLRLNTRWEKLITPLNALLGALLVLLMIKTDLSRGVLLASVDILNNLAYCLNINMQFDSGTGDWRAAIWNRAINNLYRDRELVFGQLPGFNFLDDKYLGGKLNLGGGQGLGIVRTGHNILVQMMMKAGIVGVIFYGWYFFRNLPDRSRLLVFFALSVFSLALTADVLEVPSRGPLFFSLFVVLSGLKNEGSNQASQKK